jgi:hypothetical protein
VNDALSSSIKIDIAIPYKPNLKHERQKAKGRHTLKEKILVWEKLEETEIFFKVETESIHLHFVPAPACN